MSRFIGELLTHLRIFSAHPFEFGLFHSMSPPAHSSSFHDCLNFQLLAGASGGSVQRARRAMP